MRTEILAITVLALTAAVVVYNIPRHNVPTDDLFESYKIQFNKNYESAEEEALRRQIFADNMEVARKHNANPKKTFTMGATQFSDLTSEEFAARFHGYKGEQKERNVKVLESEGVPSSVDWTTKGAVTPVKNQGDCGSCWSFSTTGSCEGVNQIHNGNLLSFSEQQLMDCSWIYGNQGCNGGLMDNAFRYLVKKGNMLESAYPYRAQSSFNCKYKQSDVKFTPSGYHDVETNSVDQLMAAVAQNPVSIAVQANQPAWQQYTGGIVSSECGQQLDHGVLAVGYGTSSGTPFWKVKNSWGANWGEQGFIRIIRNSENVCGVLSSPSYPTA